MKRYLLALCLAAAACGGTAGEDESADDVKVSATEPITWVSLAKTHAVTYAKNPVLMTIHGKATDASGFIWEFTFADWTAGNWVTVQCDGVHARVVSHHHNVAEPMGAAAIHLDQVKVTVAKLMTLAAKKGIKGPVDSIDLSEALTYDMHPHWFVQQGDKNVSVDAMTGSVFNY